MIADATWVLISNSDHEKWLGGNGGTGCQLGGRTAPGRGGVLWVLPGASCVGGSKPLGYSGSTLLRSTPVCTSPPPPSLIDR